MVEDVALGMMPFLSLFWKKQTQKLFVWFICDIVMVMFGVERVKEHDLE